MRLRKILRRLDEGGGGGGGAIPGLDPDAVDWALRVQAAGGTYNSNTLAAVSNFCTSIKNAGVWVKINRINLFAGNELTAALVPLRIGTGSATETNSNFVSGDYSLTTGLTGNGTNKKLDTGVSIAPLVKSDFSMGTWTRTNPVETANRGDIGASYSPTGDTNRFYNLTRQTTTAGQAGMGNLITTPTGWNTTGLLAQETTGATTQTVYANGVNISSVGTWNNDGFQAGTLQIFAGGNFFSNHSLSGYYTGNNLDQAALTAAWTTLNTALGR